MKISYYSFITTSLLFFVVLLITTNLNNNNKVNALTEAEKKNLSDSLKFFENYLQVSIDNAVTQLGGTSTSCSVNNVACNPYVDVPKINFTEMIPGEYGYVQPKEAPGQDYTTKMEQTCELIRMGPKWLENYNNSGNKVLYQYFTYPDDYVGFYPMSPWNCSNTYLPTERPFYTSGATGAKDIIILMDVSTNNSESEWRLSTSKKIADKIVRSLSFKDYVAVIPYGEQADQTVSLLTQANEANFELLVEKIQNITLMPNNRTNVGSALEYAFDVFSRSKSISLSSSCTQVIILLSGGENHVPTPKIGTPLEDNLNALTFPFLVTQDVTSAKVDLMEGIACASKTVSRNFTGDDNANITQWTAVTDYFSKLLALSTKRWSELYEDALGQGIIASVSAPVFTTNGLGDKVFAGVATLDAPKSALDFNGTISTQDINDYLQSNQVCTPLKQHDASQAANIADLQDGMCSAASTQAKTDAIGFKTTADGEELPINKAMPGIIVASVFAVILIVAIGCWLNKLNDDASYSYNETLPIILLGAFLVCWIICIPVFFTHTSKDLVKIHFFVETDLTIFSTTAFEYRCCEITGCTSCEYSNEERCSTMISENTADASVGNGPWPCNNGYYCCETRCYSCDCYTSCSGSGSSRSCSTHCSTCCYCARSVSRRRCYVGCGSCYLMTTKFYYRYKGELLQSQWRKTCTLQGSAECRDAWMNKYPAPSGTIGYVDPENPINVLESVGIEQPPFIAFMVFACLSIPLVLVAYYFILKEYCKRKENEDYISSTTTTKKKDPIVWNDSGSAGSDDNNKNNNSSEMEPKKPNYYFGGPGGVGNNTNDTHNNTYPGTNMHPSYYNNNNNNNYGNGDNVPPPSGGYNFGGPVPVQPAQNENYNYNASTYPPPGTHNTNNNNDMAWGVPPPPPSNNGGIQGM